MFSLKKSPVNQAQLDLDKEYNNLNDGAIVINFNLYSFCFMGIFFLCVSWSAFYWHTIFTNVAYKSPLLENYWQDALLIEHPFST